MADSFWPSPISLRVLAVDGDPLCLGVLERMLLHCNYAVMSSNEEMSAVLKGIIHGACDYLIKPLRMEELKNIWQHVVRRMGKDLQLRDGDSCGEPNKSPKSFDSLKEGEGGGRAGDYWASNNTSKKRKEQAETSSDEIVDDISGLKKTRMIWSVQLHRQFTNAVNELGIERILKFLSSAVIKTC